jgi:hypothetical protein
MEGDGRRLEYVCADVKDQKTMWNIGEEIHDREDGRLCGRCGNLSGAHGLFGTSWRRIRRGALPCLLGLGNGSIRGDLFSIIIILIVVRFFR